MEDLSRLVRMGEKEFLNYLKDRIANKKKKKKPGNLDRAISYPTVAREILDIKDELTEAGIDYDLAPWTFFDPIYYARALNRGKIKVTPRPTVQWNKEQKDLFYELLNWLFYDGAVGWADIIDMKPEDYNKQSKTLKCGERILHLSPETMQLLEANSYAREEKAEVNGHVIYFYPNDGSLLRFPTYNYNEDGQDGRGKKDLANILSRGYKLYFHDGLKPWELNSLKIYTQMEEELGIMETRSLLLKPEMVRKWLENHPVAFTEKEIRSSNLIRKLVVASPY